MAATKERVHTYLVIKGGGPAERIIVWDTQDVSLGRASENDISIDDGVLSRRHAEFYRDGGGWAIKDLGTSNGTTVNGETIRMHALANKDVVRIGDIEITFVQVAKNPAAIGKPVEYASQLKNFGGAAGQAKDGEATVLGLMQAVDEDEDEFVVGKVNDFSADLDSMQEPASRRSRRRRRRRPSRSRAPRRGRRRRSQRRPRPDAASRSSSRSKASRATCGACSSPCSASRSSCRRCASASSATISAERARRALRRACWYPSCTPWASPAADTRPIGTTSIGWSKSSSGAPPASTGARTRPTTRARSSSPRCACCATAPSRAM
jgi:hypothetical protein